MDETRQTVTAEVECVATAPDTVGHRTSVIKQVLETYIKLQARKFNGLLNLKNSLLKQWRLSLF